MVVMPPQVVEALACPVCAADLSAAGNTLVCPDRHSFDFARQGYVNLLTGLVAELSGLLAVDPDKDRRLAAALDGFTLADRESCRVPLSLSPLDVWRVAHMGPAGHHRTDPPPDADGPATAATASFVLSSYR